MLQGDEVVKRDHELYDAATDSIRMQTQSNAVSVESFF